MIPLNGCGACGHIWESFDTTDKEDPKCPECGVGGPPSVGTRSGAEIAIRMGIVVTNAIMTSKHTAENLDREIQNRVNAKIIREIEHG